MSLREKLTKPLVIDPVQDHTHTLIFLHRFPAETTDAELTSKVLSEKMTKNHKKLSEQFPSIRWVFPHAKSHARHWSNLSAEDKAELGLTTRLPYITQIILQEAQRAGGLDKIILGGQGEAAEAAHEAMSSFPAEINAAAQTAFIRAHLGHPSWTEAAQMRLAGFVGMHAQDGGVTRDVRDYGLASKTTDARRGGGLILSRAVVANTPHRFIRGGYRVQTTTWDGRRIDDLAAFLQADVGVHRVEYADGRRGCETLTPRDRAPAKGKAKAAAAEADELSEKQKYALEIVRQKAQDERDRELVLRRIEADKVERKIRLERQRQGRLHRDQGAGGAGGYLPEVRTLAAAPAPAWRAGPRGADEAGDGILGDDEYESGGW